MKVYLAWDDGDYYGPDFIGCYGTLDDAKIAVENVANRHRACNGVWEQSEDRWDFYNYHIDEVEPEVGVERIPPPVPKPSERANPELREFFEKADSALADYYKEHMLVQLAEPNPLLIVLRKK